MQIGVAVQVCLAPAQFSTSATVDCLFSLYHCLLFQRKWLYQQLHYHCSWKPGLCLHFILACWSLALPCSLPVCVASLVCFLVSVTNSSADQWPPSLRLVTSLVETVWTVSLSHFSNCCKYSVWYKHSPEKSTFISTMYLVFMCMVNYPRVCSFSSSVLNVCCIELKACNTSCLQVLRMIKE